MRFPVNIYVGRSIGAQTTGAGTAYLVETVGAVLYYVYVDNLSDVVFTKSTDGGKTWSNLTTVFTGTAVALSIWYDRWSGISAGLIHCAYTESFTDDTLYRTINTESADALSTQTVIFAGGTTANNGHLSITRARGGNVYCKTCIDAGAEGGFFRLPNANVPDGAWDAALTINEALATTDQMILLPGFAADNQDIIGIFWDAGSDEISRQLYDDSGNSWAESSIATGMVDQVATTAFPHFAAAVDLANSQIVLVAWSGVDTANADLRCWTITESAITETAANVVLNSSDDQGLAAIGIDTVTGDWHVYYGGKSDGSETFLTSVNVYKKISTDGGATWGGETRVSGNGTALQWLATAPRFERQPIAAFYASSAQVVALDALLPRVSFQLGL